MKYLITRATFNEVSTGIKRSVDLNIPTNNLEGVRHKIEDRYSAKGVCLVYEEEQ